MKVRWSDEIMDGRKKTSVVIAYNFYGWDKRDYIERDQYGGMVNYGKVCYPDYDNIRADIYSMRDTSPKLYIDFSGKFYDLNKVLLKNPF